MLVVVIIRKINLSLNIQYYMFIQGHARVKLYFFLSMMPPRVELIKFFIRNIFWKDCFPVRFFVLTSGHKLQVRLTVINGNG